ncbi:MAG: urease accessory protein UreD [Oculatellaceae cyanobacterium Prado106]|jgi:urease accessory protein|nr:urease accessory protein UreD [Oculatellaceae cyanobacterium Prado106]
MLDASPQPSLQPPLETFPENAAPTDRTWHGHLDLEFSHRPGETILSRSLVKAPLKVQRPFYPEGKVVCHSIMLHTAGGVVGGDRLSSHIQLQPQAQALLTTAAATKIYGDKGIPASQTIHIQVGAGASIEWLPQETIVFDGALYHQSLKVELAEGARWLGWDILRLGRSARGERFSKGEWRSHTEIWQQGRLIWVDPQWLQGGDDMLESGHGLAGCPVIGSLAFVGEEVSEEFIVSIRNLLDIDSVSVSSPAQIAVSRLMSGFLCRYRGHSTSECRQKMIQVWQRVRQVYGERSLCLPRVWQR